MKKISLIVVGVLFLTLLIGGLYSATKATKWREVPPHMKYKKIDVQTEDVEVQQREKANSSKQSTWIIETVDSNGDVGMYSSLALDENNRAHIAYYDYSGSALKYATNASGSWQFATIDYADIVGEFASIALDSKGNVHIAYYYCGSCCDEYGWCLIGDLRYATNASGSWQTFTIDTVGNVGLFASIAIDSNDKVHIAYHDETEVPPAKSLKYATNKSGSWQTFTIDSVLYCGHGNSIALDSNDNVYISNIDALDDSGLRLSMKTGSSWQNFLLEIVGSDSTLDSSAIAIDSNDKIHIAYYNWGSRDLRYYTNAYGGWVAETVESAGDAGQYVSIALDSQNKVHLSYCKAGLLGACDLHYATNKSGTWEIEEVDTDGDVGLYTSIKVSSNDIPHITYYHNGKYDLKYAVKGEEPPPPPPDDDVVDDDTVDDDTADDDDAAADDDDDKAGVKSVGGCGCECSY